MTVDCRRCRVPAILTTSVRTYVSRGVGTGGPGGPGPPPESQGAQSMFGPLTFCTWTVDALLQLDW